MTLAESPSSDTAALGSLETRLATDPHGMYRALHAAGSVHCIEYQDIEAWLITGYDDARGAQRPAHQQQPRLRRPADAHAARARGGAANELGQDMLRADDPRHARLRGLIGKSFATGAVNAVSPTVRRLFDGPIEQLRPQGAADLVGQYALPVATSVIFGLLGVPQEYREQVHAWLSAATEFEPGREHLVREAWKEIGGFLSRAVDGEIAMEPGGLVEHLCSVRPYDELTRDDFRSMLNLMISAGYTTTLDVIGNGLYTLLTHPDQLAALRADPGLTAGAVEEILRYAGPVMNSMLRFAVEDVEVGGAVIAAGDTVLVSFLSANRDPDRFEDPDRFDIRCPQAVGLAFGYGVHRCVEAPLAWVEAAIAIEGAVRGLPGLELAAPGDAKQWRRNRFLHGRHAVPVAFRATPATPPVQEPGS